MNTLLDEIAISNQTPHLADLVGKFEEARLARNYVNDRRSDAHLVKSYDRDSKKWFAGIYSVELSLDKRQLIATTQIAAPQVLGRRFTYEDKKNALFVWGVDAWLSAAAFIAALEVTKGS